MCWAESSCDQLIARRSLVVHSGGLPNEIARGHKTVIGAAHSTSSANLNLKIFHKIPFPVGPLGQLFVVVSEQLRRGDVEIDSIRFVARRRKQHDVNVRGGLVVKGSSP